ncbi:MAG: oligosaccharide flippase family protein [Rhodothermales bacterium]
MFTSFGAYIASFSRRLKGKGNLALFARGAGGGFLIRGLAAGLTFVSAAVMTNVLGDVEYGVYAFVLVWVNVLVLLSRSGFNRSAVRYIASYRSVERWDLLKGFLRYSRLRVILSSTTIAVVGAAGVYLFRDALLERQQPTLIGTAYVATVALVLMAHLHLQEGILDGFKKVVLSQIPQQVIRPILIALGLLALSRAAGVTVTAPVGMATTVGATLLVLGISYTFVKRALPPQLAEVEPAYDKKEWVSTSRDMMVATGFNQILMQADILLLGMLVDTTQGGIYQIASKVAGLLTIANVAANSILHPMVADLFAKKDDRELQRVVVVGANLVFVLGLVSGAVLFFGAGLILPIFGEAYAAAGTLPLRILTVGVILNLLSGPGLLLLNMTGHQRDSMYIMGTAAAINVTLNLILIPRFGAAGAATATSLSIILWNTAAAVMAYRRLKIVPMAFGLSLAKWLRRRRG